MENCNNSCSNFSCSSLENAVLRALWCFSGYNWRNTNTGRWEWKGQSDWAFLKEAVTPWTLLHSWTSRILEPVQFLKMLWSYLERSEIEMITENQVLKDFFSKPELNRSESRWPERMELFGVFSITQKPRRFKCFADEFSGASIAEGESVVNGLETSDIGVYNSTSM